LIEVKVSTGIFAVGFLIFTFITKIAIAIIFEDFNIQTLRREKRTPAQ
jgi:ABC-type polysaccharide transport system permease subunit